MLIDLGAERLIAAEKADQKIAVEVKSFAGSSNLSEFHTALGQFLNYRLALAEYDPERRLYLAIPRDVYRSFFFTRFALAVQQAYPLNLIVIAPDQEVIVEWIKPSTTVP
jgi:hypothetical protein